MKFEFSTLLERVDVAGQKRYKNEKTYHRDVYWEDWFDDACRKIINSINLSERSSLSLHAWRYLDGEDDKRNHQVDFSDFASAVMRIRNNIETAVFECTVVYDTVIKCVARTTLNDEDDIAIVFADGIIKTFWTNSKSDAHKTLNKRKYQNDASVYNRGMKEAYFSIKDDNKEKLLW